MKKIIKLLSPQDVPIQDLFEMYQEIPREDEGGWENKAKGISLKEFKSYIQKLIDHGEGKDLEPPENTKIYYFAIKNNVPVGIATLRPKLNDYWKKHSGNISYLVRPSERSKGLGKLILSEVLEKAREMGMTEVFVQCNCKNIASQKIVETNGGKKIKESNGSVYYKIKILTK